MRGGSRRRARPWSSPICSRPPIGGSRPSMSVLCCGAERCCRAVSSTVRRPPSPRRSAAGGSFPASLSPWRAGPRSSSVRRFTITPERIAGGRVVFDRDESHHLARVLRLRSGDTVLAADGTGHEYTVRLETVGERATGTVLGGATPQTESPLHITLVHSVPHS